MSDVHDFLGRWSRRKAEARRAGATAPPEEAATPSPAAAPEPGEAAAPLPQAQAPGRLPDEVAAEPTAAAPHATEGGRAEKPFDPASLPSLEELTGQSDYRDFLRPEVPAELRRRALRHLWRSDPVYANLDGLLEYGEDFSGLGKGTNRIATAWQLGRGFADRLEQAAGVLDPSGDEASPAARPQAPAPGTRPSGAVPAVEEGAGPATLSGEHETLKEHQS